MTLIAVIAFILRFFLPNSTDFQVDYITVVEDYITLHRNYLKSPMVKKLLNDCPM